MIAVASLIAVVVVALMVERVAALAPGVTGLPIDATRFQSRSALTGVGFTTGERETIVNHPVRRRIVLVLMLTGNAGFITIIASLVFSFSGTGSSAEVAVRLAILVGALMLSFLIARTETFERLLSRMILRALERWTDLDVRDMVNVLRLTRDDTVTELQVRPGDWVANETLARLHLPEEDVLVLGILRADGSFIGAPRGGTVIHDYGTLILYGRSSVLGDLEIAQRAEGATRPTATQSSSKS